MADSVALAGTGRRWGCASASTAGWAFAAIAYRADKV